MFDRFTPEARHVVVLSQEEARGAGDDAIRAEHLLLAVLVGGGVGQRVLEGLGVEPGRVRPVAASLSSERADANALATIGIDLEEVRRCAETTFGPGALDGDRSRGRRGSPSTIPFSSSARAGLEGALAETDRRRSGQITDGHVLLALLAGDQAPAARLLRRLDVDPADVRLRLEEAMAPI